MTRPLSVLLLTRYDRRGASSRLRFLDYLPHLAEHGIAVAVRPFFDPSYLDALYAGRRLSPLTLAGAYLRRLRVLTRRAAHDAIWLEKEALPWLPGGLERVLLSGPPLVVDFDDAWYLRYQTHPRPQVRRLLGDKFAPILGLSRLAVVGNATLAAWAERNGARTILRLPTTVDPARYRPARAALPGHFTIGWIGSPSSAAYLAPLAPALAELCRVPGTELMAVGSGPLALAGVRARVLDWAEDEEADRIAECDVGIMPLSADPWSEGKCAYKLIQYMAASLPVVASPVGMNREVVAHGVTGFLAETPEEWFHALDTLRRDPDLRRAMGQAGRRRVERDFSLPATAPHLAAALRHAAGRM